VKGTKVSTKTLLIKLCNDRLADAVDLQLQSKHAYWNTTDPDLMPVRQHLGEFNKWCDGYIDRIAERAVELGGVADSTERVVPTWSHVLCSADACNRNHAQTIATAAASFGELVRQAIYTANEFSDPKTVEMFTEIAEGADKWHRTIIAL
jgi:starvation-inducible DNA-binding protein